MKRNVFAEIKAEDTKRLRVLFHKRKHDSEFVLSSIKAFKEASFHWKKIIHALYEWMASLKSLYSKVFIQTIG